MSFLQASASRLRLKAFEVREAGSEGIFSVQTAMHDAPSKQTAETAFSVPPPEGARVRACIVNWRAGEAAVDSVRSALTAGAEVVVFDNSPGDGTAELLAPLGPAVRILSSPRNLGFAAASNRAASGAGTDYLLFLNPDARIEPRDLSLLVCRLDEDPSAGIAGPTIRFPDGRLQLSVRTDPTARAILHQYTALRYTGIFRPAFRRYCRPPLPPGGGPVPVLMGSVLLVRLSLFEALGGFDEHYFIYFEEADLCRRARELGFGVVLVSEAEAVHEGGRSARQAATGLEAVRLVSATRYIGRFASPGNLLAFRVAFLLTFPIRAMVNLVRDTGCALLFLFLPPKHGKVRHRFLSAIAAARLLSTDLFRIVAAATGSRSPQRSRPRNRNRVRG